MDIKLQCINGFKLKYLTFSEHLVLDNNIEKYLFYNNTNQNIYNAFIICKSKNLFLLDCINQIVYNVKHKYFGKSPLDITGPRMLGNIYKNNNYKIPIDIKYILSNISNIINPNLEYKNIQIINSYPTYRKNQISKYLSGKHFTLMWFNKNIYV